MLSAVLRQKTLLKGIEEGKLSINYTQTETERTVDQSQLDQ